MNQARRITSATRGDQGRRNDRDRCIRCLLFFFTNCHKALGWRGKLLSFKRTKQIKNILYGCSNRYVSNVAYHETHKQPRGKIQQRRQKIKSHNVILLYFTASAYIDYPPTPLATRQHQQRPTLDKSE